MSLRMVRAAIMAGLACFGVLLLGSLFIYLGDNLQEAKGFAGFNVFFALIGALMFVLELFLLPRNLNNKDQSKAEVVKEAQGEVRVEEDDEVKEDEEEEAESDKKYKPCPDCGKPIYTDDSFCPSCGYCLGYRHVRDSCNVCGALFFTNNRRQETGNQDFAVRFCPACGQRSRQKVDAASFEGS